MKFMVTMIAMAAMLLWTSNPLKADENPYGSRTPVTSSGAVLEVSQPPTITNTEAYKYVDNFDGANDTTALKARGYTIVRNGGPAGTAAIWFQGNPTVFNAYNGPTNGYVGSNFNSTTGANTIDNWLVLPAVNVVAGDTIRFYERGPSPNSFPDSIEVLYSAVGDSLPGGSWVSLDYFRTTETGSWGLRKYAAPSSGAAARFALRYYIVDGGPSGTNSNYIGIDAVTIGEPPANNLAALRLVFPASGSGTTPNTLISIAARFLNAGTAAATGNVKYQILTNPGPETIVYDETESITSLAPGDSILVNFPSIPAGLSAGSYIIRAIALLAGDEQPSDDTLSGTFTVAPLMGGYTFQATSGSFTPLTGATSPPLSGGSNDEGRYNGIPIGFTFPYNGGTYTSIAASTNGWLSLGTSSLGLAVFSNNLRSGATTAGTGSTNARPVLAPLWDDLDMASGTFSYKTEVADGGTQVFVAEWLNVEWNWLAAGPVISFQARLHEDGLIEFVYRQEGTAVNSGSASIGITAADTGAGNFISLSNTSASPGVSSTSETTSLNIKPATGQIYSFIPPPPLANDMGTISLDVPVNGGGVKENVTFSPKATFRNFGTAAQTSVNVRYEIYDSGPSLVYSSDKVIASIAPATNEQVTFDPVSGGLSEGSYTMRVFSQLGTDGDNTNDTLAGSFLSRVFVASFPYFEDFEDPSPETGGLGWSTYSVSGGVNQWTRGTPTKPYLSGAYSGTKAYVTRLDSQYANNHNGALEAPILDFTSLAGDPILSFWQKGMSEVNWDGMVVEMSTNGGTTWSRVDSTLGTGGTFATARSNYWYNNNSTLGPLTPPKFSDTTAAKYTGHDNGWINSTTTLVGTAGLADVRLRFRFVSDASVVREGIAIDDVSILAGVTSSVTAGWNIVSNPVSTVDDSVSQLFPTASPNYGFSFSGATGYAQSYTMDNGKGYWVKFPGATGVTFAGSFIPNDSIDVALGWNLIGSISAAVDTGDITSAPSGIVTTPYYNFPYGSGEPQILPGKGYWVKTNAAGKLYLSNSPAPNRPAVTRSVFADYNSITITDAAGASQTLYFGTDQGLDLNRFEMPPAPPVEAFDARFETGRILATDAEMVIVVQSLSYPLTVSWNIVQGEYTLHAGATKSLQGEGTMTIQSGNRIVLRGTGAGEIPAEFALEQNYPNPFNPVTNITYALPVESRVTMEVFNALGQRVKVLVNGSQAAGYHTAEWNGTGNADQTLGSGVYFVRLNATGVDGRSFTNLRKMLLMK